MIEERIQDELKLLKKFKYKVQYVDDGRWILIQEYSLSDVPSWNRETVDICFQIPAVYPATNPYGFYVVAGIRVNNNIPVSYTEPSKTKPPFNGEWGFFSWTPSEAWFPTDDLSTGSNLLNFVLTFKDRFNDQN